jgi:pSer/pThr/pTyr-binding forkhead associated (FHA) protein
MSHPTVSRRHARLTQTETGWTLRDLASSNGTYLNGARITDTALVHPGDEVWLGSVRLSLVRPQRPKR